MTGCTSIDERKIKELRNFLSKISDPEVQALIDISKLYRTEVFAATVQMASEHAVKHQDFSFVERILNLLEGTDYADDLVEKLQPRLGFIVTQTVPRKIKKGREASSEKALLLEKPVAATKHKAVSPLKVAKQTKRIAQVRVNVKSVAKPKRKVVYVVKSEDLMDSRLMLPGGYGTGLRR